MSKPLQPLIFQAPGFFGLNTQQAGLILPPGWASLLDNFVWDNLGRLAARNGTKKLHSSVITNTPDVRQCFEYIDASGSKLNIFAADNKIYSEVSGTLTDISTNIGSTMTLPTADSWQFANFNGWCVGFQDGHPCIILTSVSGQFIDSTGTQHDGDMVLSAWGRKWTVVNNTLYHSDLLIDDMTGGSSGNFDLAVYWPNGMDKAVALADFNGFLIVFGKNSIIVYQNPDDPTVMTIVEGVDGVGCIARDSVQIVGKEIIFLSNDGLKTLGRTIQEKSVPLGDISKNVRDDLLNLVAAEVPTNIKSVYNVTAGFYLLSLPVAGISYIFDLTTPNEDGSLKAGRWDFAPTAMNYTEGKRMHVAVTTGWLSHYTSFLDEKDSDGANGTKYTVDFEGVWNDFGQDLSPFNKILKRVSVLAAGSPSGAVIFKWATDYNQAFDKLTLTFDAAAVPSKYDGVSEYNNELYTYQAVGDFELVKGNISRQGQVLQVGLTAVINNAAFALQRITLLAKIGKLGL